MWASSLQFDYGPGPVQKDPDKMNAKDLRTAFVYAYGALNLAFQEGRSDEFLEALEETYEDYLTRFCAVSQIIPKSLEAEVHVFPWPRSESISRQTRIIREASAN